MGRLSESRVARDLGEVAGAGELFTALKAQKADGYLFNGQKTSEGLRSPLFDKAKAYGLQSVEIAKPFSYGEGLAIFESMQVENRFVASEAPGWPKLAVQLERTGIQQAAAVLAFLQGAILRRQEARHREWIC